MVWYAFQYCTTSNLQLLDPYLVPNPNYLSHEYFRPQGAERVKENQMPMIILKYYGFVCYCHTPTTTPGDIQFKFFENNSIWLCIQKKYWGIETIDRRARSSYLWNIANKLILLSPKFKKRVTYNNCIFVKLQGTLLFTWYLNIRSRDLVYPANNPMIDNQIPNVT